MRVSSLMGGYDEEKLVLYFIYYIDSNVAYLGLGVGKIRGDVGTGILVVGLFFRS
ncbi:hypothetical protein ACERII_05680 [Evansella sp. AB-rgal1]|uniref:hypothetical protein n=1 Tax=Evansella sp. AB-rgal1 TaxID=3242696 RepID=UPI00359D7A68